MFVSDAFAQAADAAPGYDPFGFFMPLILIFAVFYFLLIRPQNKRIKETEKMRSGIRRGDKVVTAGGIVGTVAKVSGDDILMVTIAKDVQVEVLRNTVLEVVSKSGAVKETGENDTSDEDNGDGDDKPARKSSRRSRKN